MAEIMTPTKQFSKMLERIIKGLLPRYDQRFGFWLLFFITGDQSTLPFFIGSPGTGSSDERRVTAEELMGVGKSLIVGKP